MIELILGLGPIDYDSIRNPTSAMFTSTDDDITWRSVIMSGIERRIDMKVKGQKHFEVF